ncbi:hypothetical protein GCM10023334_028360 [Nonomuraea thailandensis]
MRFDTLGMDLGVVEDSAGGDGDTDGADATERPATLGVGIAVEAAFDRDAAPSVPQEPAQTLKARNPRRPATSVGRASRRRSRSGGLSGRVGLAKTSQIGQPKPSRIY